MSNATRWVGIDLHRKRSHVAVIDEQGELTLSRRIVNDRDTFLELLGDPQDGDTHVALEATYGWEWLAELLEEAGYDLHLAHPLRTRAIAAARVKTDAIDAKTLAHLLRTGFLPEAYIAPRDLRDLRELLRHRDADSDALGGQEPRARDPRQARNRERALRPVRQRRPRVPRRAGAA
jgi:transposase